MNTSSNKSYIITMPTLDGVDSEAKREEIQAYFDTCYKRYESLFRLIADHNAYYQKADSLRHPLIFYYGHTATFFINKLKLAKVIDTRIDAELESLFAVGVDEMSWDDLNEAHYEWPSLERVQAYRDDVYVLVKEVIASLPLTLPITEESPWWVILMGIEHENIHLETSSVLIRQLPLENTREDEAWKACTQYTDAPQNSWIEVLAGSVVLGKDHEAKLFGWDNEYGKHEAHIPSFKAAKYLTSNAEFLAFVQEGGYDEDAYWCEEGRAWRDYTRAEHPMFWRKSAQGYVLRTLSKEIVLPLSWPVEVNHLEASAFCVWKSQKEGVRVVLPTEDEYVRLRDASGVPAYLEWTVADTNIAAINLETFASSVPVNTHKHGDFYDVIGNVWQHSRTPMYPFDGFKVHPVYDDFTVPIFDAKHKLINGGSWISCGNLATQKSRYGFRRHFYQHAGFRYIQSNYKEKVRVNMYNTDTIIAQYCHFGWGENSLGVENYPTACAHKALAYMKTQPKRKALDIGCAIGRSSFELARGFDEVIGVDFSARFIQEAGVLKDEGILRYSIKTEGDLEQFYEVNLETFGLGETRQKVSFWQADACNLKSIYKEFDLIFGGNLIDRLYDPQKFLEDVAHRLVEGGMLILTSPYTWQEESTPKEKWIGGYKRDGEAVSTLQGLKEMLGGDFVLIATEDVPFVIQETARKHQHSIAQMSVWQKRIHAGL
jgi:5-histidylcysteine sulfoxide synthase/putative 4-mercaptohistidine N1-methyltranferase